eukprot:g1497.t1
MGPSVLAEPYALQEGVGGGSSDGFDRLAQFLEQKGKAAVLVSSRDYAAHAGQPLLSNSELITGFIVPRSELASGFGQAERAGVVRGSRLCSVNGTWVEGIVHASGLSMEDEQAIDAIVRFVGSAQRPLRLEFLMPRKKKERAKQRQRAKPKQPKLKLPKSQSVLSSASSSSATRAVQAVLKQLVHIVCRQHAQAHGASPAQQQQQQYNPAPGWTREIVTRSSGATSNTGRKDVYYYSPLRIKLRSLPEVATYLAALQIRDTPTLADFSFNAKSTTTM